MTIVTGIFDSPGKAHRAALSLRRNGLKGLNLLLPGATAEQLEEVPTSESEQPGMGAAVGGLVGGAVGAAGGLGLGTAAAATFLVPGVGPVLAVGLAAAAVFGIGGAVTGAAAGSALEEKSTPGLPVDELFVYHDALRRGKSIVFVRAKDADEAERASVALADAGAESIDAARDQHWIGLRSAEREHYRALGGDFEKDERAYRRGFECGMAEEELESTESEGRAFRCGYERGVEYRRRQQDRASGAGGAFPT
jgi:hypothetical protein